MNFDARLFNSDETVLFTLLKSQELWILEIKQRALKDVGCTGYRFCEIGEMREMIQSDDRRGLNPPRLYTNGAEKQLRLGRTHFVDLQSSAL
jgi:hypothetical protein